MWSTLFPSRDHKGRKGRMVTWQTLSRKRYLVTKSKHNYGLQPLFIIKPLKTALKNTLVLFYWQLRFLPKINSILLETFSNKISVSSYEISVPRISLLNLSQITNETEEQIEATNGLFVIRTSQCQLNTIAGVKYEGTHDLLHKTEGHIIIWHSTWNTQQIRWHTTEKDGWIYHCRSGHSTETALLKIKNDTELALDRILRACWWFFSTSGLPSILSTTPSFLIGSNHGLALVAQHCSGWNRTWVTVPSRSRLALTSPTRYT